jgi:hypothetical protein
MFFKMENAIRRSAGVLKYSSRFNGLPAGQVLENTLLNRFPHAGFGDAIERHGDIVAWPPDRSQL